MRHLVFVLIAACGSSPRAPGVVRFANREPVTLVNDRKPIEPPKKFDEGLVQYYVDNDLIDPTERALTVEPPSRAENINALGGVPDSAWFTNRRPTPEQIRSLGLGGPDRSQPWRVIGVKVGGAAIGISIEDARHDKYVLKFDERGYPEAETSADVVVQRLTWAFGYNVPDNTVVTFARDRLVLDPDAVVKFRNGKTRPMTADDLATYLDMADSDHGTFRALATKLIDGKILGGIEPEGTRKGDPNDRVPHELRRDLRGQRMLWAWVNHVDIKSQNTLATYTDDNYVQWYALDFGESLGVGALTTGTPRLGHRTAYSAKHFFAALVTFGLVAEPWERKQHYPRLRGLGHFDSETFDPATWTPAHNWRPTDAADRFDEFWAADILMRFTRAHIAAAVAAGEYTDARTAAYLEQTLVARQQKIGRYAFSRVAPLTDITVRDGLELCFDDLWLRYNFGLPAATTYRARAFDHAGTLLATTPWTTARDAHGCVAGVPAGTSHEGYTIVEISVRRDDTKRLLVHVARGPSGPRVIGIDRR